MIGLDISAQAVKVVQLDQRDHSLVAYARLAIPAGVIAKGVVTDSNRLAATVAEALRQCRLTSKIRDSVVGSIPESQSFLRVIEIPVMAADEVNEAIQWEVAQHIPFGLENVYIDWQPLAGGHKPAAGRQEVLVGAAQRQVVDSLVSALQALKLDVAALELESQAIVRSLISPELRAQEGLLIVDLGGSGTNVVIHDHGTIRFTATLQKGVIDLRRTLLPRDLAASADESGQLPAEEVNRLAQLLAPSAEQLVTEIRSIIEFYNSIDAQHEVQEILLTGGGANLPGLDQVFLRFFENVHVQRGNPWVNILSGKKVARPPMDVRESVRYATALGLALRPV